MGGRGRLCRGACVRCRLLKVITVSFAPLRFGCLYVVFWFSVGLHRITERLYVSSVSGAMNLKELRQHRISHILCVASGIRYCWCSGWGLGFYRRGLWFYSERMHFYSDRFIRIVSRTSALIFWTLIRRAFLM